MIEYCIYEFFGFNIPIEVFFSDPGDKVGYHKTIPFFILN